ncbi:unnamed protein product [Calypogeia fissa]
MAEALTPWNVPLANVVITTVKPLQKTNHVETIDTTFLDLAPVDGLIPLFFAYRLEDKSDANYLQLLNRLKESLQKVLVLFFGFAGRWIATAKGSRDRQLLCNDEGVPFIEAFVDKDLDSIVHASAAFQPVSELQGYELLGLDSTQYTQQMLPEGLPCLFVQVTRFRCGGVVIATTFNHMLTDGKGFFNFMTAWSDLSRTDETNVKVDHNRALTEKSSFQELISKHAGPSLASTGSRRPLWAMKAVEVSTSSIKSLKQEAIDNKYGPGFVSTGDCILAYVWKSISRVPSAMLGGKQVVITMNVEGRRRYYDPPIPDLCGNVMAPMVAPKIPTDEVQHMSVASIASKIRDKLHNTRTEEWLSLERLEETLEVYSSGRFAPMRTTSWFGFPVYDMDIGFGTPCFVSGLNYRCSLSALGTMYIGPPIPSSSDSIAVLYICSTPELLEALQRDLEFLLLFCCAEGKGNESR